MRARESSRAQLALPLPARDVEVPAEVEQLVVSLLADLLLSVATGARSVAEGARDERQDRQ